MADQDTLRCHLWMAFLGVLVFVGVPTSVVAAQQAPGAAALPSPAAAMGPAGPQEELRTITAPAISAESEEKLHAAFEHLYNLEFTQARTLFEQIAQAEPASATVRAFWASAILYEMLAHQGSLQAQLFVSKDFLKHERLPPDPELDREFHRLTEEAVRLARRRLEADQQDVDGLFALGLAYGNRANYLVGVNEEYFRGLRLGEKAADYHEKLRKVRPEIHDSSVVLGIHDYILGNLRLAQRFLLFFLGAHGDRERGLEYLREAAAHGEFLRPYASTLLVVTNMREGNLERAANLAAGLRAEYPRNPIFALELARLYRRLEQHAEATRVCQSLLAELLAHPHNPRIVGLEDALLELGLIEAAQGQWQRALQSLARVESIPEANPRVLARATLERGKIYDRLGEREKALAEYEKVIDLAVDITFTRPALNYRQRPYQVEKEKE
ncbi:MAG: tetratricopeptide repeat protein [Candidatus Acidoferrales bacterium]